MVRASLIVRGGQKPPLFFVGEIATPLARNDKEGCSLSLVA